MSNKMLYLSFDVLWGWVRFCYSQPRFQAAEKNEKYEYSLLSYNDIEEVRVLCYKQHAKAMSYTVP